MAFNFHTGFKNDTKKVFVPAMSKSLWEGFQTVAKRGLDSSRLPIIEPGKKTQLFLQCLIIIYVHCSLHCTSIVLLEDFLLSQVLFAIQT